MADDSIKKEGPPPAPPPDFSSAPPGQLVGALQVNIKRNGKWLGWAQSLSPLTGAAPVDNAHGGAK